MLGAHVNARPSHHGGRTVLQAAVRGKNIDIVKLLVGAGANVNADAAPENGLTCLQEAARGGNIELLNYLLQSGATVNGLPSAQNGRTALQVAVEVNQPAVVMRLLEGWCGRQGPSEFERWTSTALCRSKEPVL